MKPKRIKIFFVCLATIMLPIVISVVSAQSSLEPHLLAEEAYSETYGLVFTIDENSHLIVQLSVSNLGLGDQNGMCRILYIDQNGSWSADSFYDRKMWTFKSPASLKMGTCSFDVSEKKLVISAELNQGKVQAVLHGDIHLTNPPHHFIKLADGFFDQQIIMRWGQAELKFDLPDRPSFEALGFGCMYRFWVTALPPDLAHRWVRVFGLDENGSTIIVARYPTADTTASGWGWFSKNQAPSPIDSFEYQKTKNEKTTISGEIAGVQYQLILQKLLHRHAPIEDLGFWGRLIRPWIGNPVTYTYKASLTTSTSDKKSTVIVEVTEDE